MGQESRVIEILSACRTFFDACVAFYADAGYLRRVFGGDGAHRACFHAGAASGADLLFRLRLCLEEYGRLAVDAQRCILRTDRIVAPYSYGSRDIVCVDGRGFCRDFLRELFQLLHIATVRSAGSQLI